MSIWAGSKMCLSFKRELLEGLHNFALDTFRIALYSPDAVLSDETESYTGIGELLPIQGYTTGGKTIQIDPPLLVEKTAIVPFHAVLWTPAQFKARGALIYNASKPNLPAIFVADFGSERESNGNNFAVLFPGPDPNAAILRLL